MAEVGETDSVEKRRTDKKKGFQMWVLQNESALARK